MSSEKIEECLSRIDNSLEEVKETQGLQTQHIESLMEEFESYYRNYFPISIMQLGYARWAYALSIMAMGLAMLSCGIVVADKTIVICGVAIGSLGAIYLGYMLIGDCLRHIRTLRKRKR